MYINARVFRGSYPTLTITCNNSVIFNEVVIEESSFNFECDENSNIVISGIKKVNGDNNVWDTVIDIHGNIIKDKYLKIVDIIISGVSMTEYWIRKLPLSTLNGDTTFSNQSFYENGEISFNTKSPILNWIINEKFISPESSDVDTRSGLGRYDYSSIKLFKRNTEKSTKKQNTWI